MTILKDYSQNGESKILGELFQKIGIDKGYFVDIGAGDGYEMSNTRMFKDMGWSGEMYDSKAAIGVLQWQITKENITPLLQFTPTINLLSIDIDGNDYWILEGILQRKNPDVLCFEINSEISLTESLVMPYNPSHVWDGTTAFGMSYKAGQNLCHKHHYDIYTVVNSQNVIAVRKELNIEPLEYSVSQTKSHPVRQIEWIKL